MLSDKEPHIRELIEDLVRRCGNDFSLALDLLMTIDHEFPLPKPSIIPRGKLRNTLEGLLCMRAGVLRPEDLPNSNDLRPAQSKRVAFKNAVVARSKLKTINGEETRLLKERESSRIKNLANETSKLIKAKIKVLEDQNKKVPFQPIRADGIGDRHYLFLYVFHAFTIDVYNRTTESAFTVSKATYAALIVSYLSQLSGGWNGYTFWVNDENLKVSEEVALGFAACGYVINASIVFPPNDDRYRGLISKPSIFAARPTWVGRFLLVPWVLQTALSATVSPYVTVFKITLEWLRYLALPFAMISPWGSNGSVLTKWIYNPLEQSVTSLMLYNNWWHEENRKMLANRTALIELIENAIAIFMRMDNAKRDTNYRAYLSISKEGDSKTNVATAKFRFLAHFVHNNKHLLPAYRRQELWKRKLAEMGIELFAIAYSAWGQVNYRKTGYDSICDWEPRINERFNTTLQCPPELGTTVGYDSWSTNLWYGVGGTYLVINFIKMMMDVYPNYRLWTIERIVSIILFLAIVVVPAASQIQLANDHKDPWNEPLVTISNNILMMLSSLYSMQFIFVTRFRSKREKWLQEPGFSKMYANHVANKQALFWDSELNALIATFMKLDIAMVSHLYEAIRVDVDEEIGVTTARPNDDFSGENDDDDVIAEDTFSHRLVRVPTIRRAQSTNDVRTINRVRMRMQLEEDKIVLDELMRVSNHLRASQTASPLLSSAFRDENEWSSKRGRANTITSRFSPNDKMPIVWKKSNVKTMLTDGHAMRHRSHSFSGMEAMRPWQRARHNPAHFNRDSNFNWASNTKNTLFKSIHSVVDVVHADQMRGINRLIEQGVVRQAEDHLELHPDMYKVARSKT